MPNLAVKLPCGEVVEGPTEKWVCAILMELTEAQRARVLERVRKGTMAFSTPGHHVLQVATSRGVMPLQAFTAEERARARRPRASIVVP